MSLQLNGKRSLVTGGSRGVGRAIVRALAAHGARVVTCYREDQEAAADLERELKSLGPGHRVLRADVRQPDDAALLAHTCGELFGGLDVVVNNAGVDGHSPIEELEPQEWHRVLDTNLTALHLVTRAVLPLMSRNSTIINIGASAAERGQPFRSHYTASKAAVIGWSRSLAKELGPRGIRVNVVAPGVIGGDDNGPPPQILERIKAATALGRLGEPDDIARAVVFLASDESSYLSGATITVDGGI
ncbi:SDR family NAD(P)-dependent oxidoreductase [Nonomuraea sediminis]|uniref:SDR family NAD(P)-dependent oxidoreductase n=1 Tax=Nonomuraea sediminis TaxID=2835864 RepID=UPI001BDC0936|nr:SDR family NAD(P)-dependent oxidoreductase [Nonomuraea sediminis]